MIRLDRAVWCPDCNTVFELADRAPCCGGATFHSVARMLNHEVAVGRPGSPDAEGPRLNGLRPAPDPPVAAATLHPRSALGQFLRRWAGHLARDLRRQFADEAIALAREHERIERRRLVTDAAYRAACQETMREVALNKSLRGRT